MGLCRCPAFLQALAAGGAIARCPNCRDVIIRARPLTRPEFVHLLDQMSSRLVHLADYHRTVDDLAVAPVRRPDGTGIRSGIADPTGAAVADERRQTVRAHFALAGWYLKRAAAQLKNADESMGDAEYAADPGRARGPGQWYPETEWPGAEVDQQRAYQAKREANGEA